MSGESIGERHYSTRSPDRVWDYIVVGSGMGGMTSAALLSELGYRVLVLEQHYVPGGFTHTFKRKRWVWDVGVHAVGEVEGRAQIARLLEKLTGGRLEWASLGPVYDEFWFPDLRIDFPDNKQAFASNLRDAFPTEGTAIDEYLRQIRDVSGVMRQYYLSRLLPPAWAPLTDPLLAREAHRMLTQTTRAALDRFCDHDRLKSVLTAQWGYYGVPPERSSFAIHALVARHFLHGGYYPVGGSGRIAAELLATVADAGGWTRIRAEVDGLVIEGGRAAGVRLRNGEMIRSRRVISAVGALPTVERLLPARERERPWARAITRLKPSPCHVCLYLGFKGDITRAGASAANRWFYETWAKDAVYWDVERQDRDAPVLYCSFPSLKDPRHDPGPELLHTGEVVTFVPYRIFERWTDERWKRRGQDYDELKKELTERLLAQFLRHMPGIQPMIAFAELSTPLSTEHFTRATNGAIYGLEPTPERYQTRSLRPRTPISGFFLSGSDMASVGVIGAMVGGVLCAVAAEPIKAIPYLRAALAR
jgi:all-trans-retinol 13,14-reductase